MPRHPVPTIESRGVSAKEPLHADDEIGLRRFHDEVKMIRHQAIGMNLPTGFAANILQRLDKTLAITVVVENILPPVAPAHDVIDRSGEFYA